MALLNKALLCKWSWRFAVEREALWRQVICGKYGKKRVVGSLVKREEVLRLVCGKPLGKIGM